jgi:hypothetical protein
MSIARAFAARLAPLAFAALAPALAACAGAEATPRATTTAASSAAVVLPPGALVRVERGGTVLEGRVVRPEGRDVYRVQYDVYGPSFTELVAAARVHEAPAAPAFTAGEHLLVRTAQRPMLAEVVQPLADGRVRVHYEGFPATAVEDVGPDRIIRPFTGAAPHRTGEAIGVDVNGRVMPARVVAVVDAAQYLARFDGFGAEYDQVVGPDRLRPAPDKAHEAAAVAPSTPAAPPVAAPEPSTKGKKASKDKAAPAAAPTAHAGPPKVGDAVLVPQRGAFTEATVSAVEPNGVLRVKLTGPGPAAEQQVPAAQVAHLVDLPKGVVVAPNQPVFVEWHGLFVPGKAVKQAGKGQYRIRFEGFGPELDEVVPVRRLRARP